MDSSVGEQATDGARRLGALVARVREAVLVSPGVTQPALRQSVEERAAEVSGRIQASGVVGPIPSDLSEFVEHVAVAAWRVTSEEVGCLARCRVHRGRGVRGHGERGDGGGLRSFGARAGGSEGRGLMRLSVVERGHRFPQKLQLAMIRVFTRRRAVDIIRTVMYRPEFFGRPMNEWTQMVMRGPSDWAVWERELFAAFTSRLNQCVF